MDTFTIIFRKCIESSPWKFIALITENSLQGEHGLRQPETSMVIVVGPKKKKRSAGRIPLDPFETEGIEKGGGGGGKW